MNFKRWEQLFIIGMLLSIMGHQSGGFVGFLLVALSIAYFAAAIYKVIRP